MTARLLAPAAPLLAALALALPPAGAADAPTKKELEAAAARLKEVGIAFHNFGDRHGDRWADDVADKDGRFVLSWRVALLPYLGEEKLYKEFKLDEPWDSDHNKKLIGKMPKVYEPARGKAKPGETYLQRFVGTGAVWTEKGAAYTIPGIPDGTSNTALVVEAGEPVIWTKPADLTFIKDGPLPGLGGPFGGDFHVLMGDGSVLLFKAKFDQDEMKKVVMPDDGQVWNGDKLLKK